MKVKQKCSDCDGKGLLPALGMNGLAPDDPARRDQTRHFPRLCPSCNGSGERWVEVSVAEGSSTALSALALFERLIKRL